MRWIKGKTQPPAQGIDMQKIQIEQQSSIGLLWAAGWLFTIGYLQLTFWKGVLAIIIWPYYIGATFVSPPA